MEIENSTETLNFFKDSYQKIEKEQALSDLMNFLKRVENQKDQNSDQSTDHVSTETSLLAQINNSDKVRLQTVVKTVPQKFINIEKCYRLFDDIFMHEDNLMVCANEVSCPITKKFFAKVEPLNQFKYIDYVQVHDQQDVVSLLLKEKVNCNSPPLEYIAQRFMSFGNQQMYSLSQTLLKYLETKKNEKYTEDPCQLNEHQRRKQSDDFLFQNTENMLYIVEAYQNQHGLIQCTGYHFSRTFLKLLGYNMTDFQIYSIKNGLIQFKAQHESLATLNFLLNLEIAKSQKKYPRRQDSSVVKMIEFQKMDGCKIILNCQLDCINKNGMAYIKVSLHGNDIMHYTKPMEIISDYNRQQNENEKMFIEQQNQHISQKQHQKLNNIFQCQVKPIR